MQLDPKYQPPTAPWLLTRRLPAAEQGVASSISSNLQSLSTEATNLAAAIALFGFSSAQYHALHIEQKSASLWSQWAKIAARDGAMSIRNFGDALAKVRGLIGRAPSWLPHIDSQALKSAEARFNTDFPFAHKLRHAVAHPELYNDPTKAMGVSSMDELGIKVEGGNLTIQSMISGSTFASTFEGVLVKYDLTSQTLDAILSIINTSYDAFAKADERGHRRFQPL